MSHYAYEVQDATTRINRSDFEVVERIKDAARTEKWCGYGWRNELLDATTIEEVAEIFGIELVDEGEGYYRPFIDEVYVSHFFETMIDIVAPYMTDGVIKVDDEYNIVTIVFENGKANVFRE